MLNALNRKAMRKVATLKKPKKLTNSQLRNLKRLTIQQAQRANLPPLPQIRPIAKAIRQHNQLIRHQTRAKERQRSRDSGFTYAI